MPTDNLKHVLVSVLDWGLGHATRCIPVINCLLANNCKVSIAGNGSSLVLLKKEFPQLTFHELSSYKVTYPTHRFFFLHLLIQVPHIINTIRKENKEIKKLVKENKIDAVISDNRYGCYSDQVPSVLITHQLNIQLPVLLSWSKCIIDYVNHRLIKKFNACWVPDFSSEGLSGKLSDTQKLKVRFVGILSRFALNKEVEGNDLVVGLVSGPEPQRAIFEKLLMKEFKKLNQPGLIVRGLPHLIAKEIKDGKVSIIAHATAHELERIISKASIVISRSGYSTIMDMQALGKKRVIFVPTPGQTEQEYLANRLERRKIAFTQKQVQFNLTEAIQKSKDYNGFDATLHHTNLLNEAVQDLLHQI